MTTAPATFAFLALGDWAMRPIEFGRGWWVFLAALATTVVVWQAWRWYRKRNPIISATQSWTLFTDLCRAHRLSAKEIWLLASLAQSRQLDQPATVFVDPAQFDEEGLEGRLRQRIPQLSQLRGKLYAAEEG